MKETNRFAFLKRLNPIRPFKHMPLTYQGASLFVLIGGLLIFAVQNAFITAHLTLIDYILQGICLLVIIFLLGLALNTIIALLHKLPSFYRWLALSFFLIMTLLFMSTSAAMIVLPIYLIICLSVLGASLYPAVKRKKWPSWKAWLGIFSSGLLLVLVLVWWLYPGTSDLTYRQLVEDSPSQPTLDIPHQVGPYDHHTLTYGAKDTYRDLFNQEASLVTQAVDGSAFIDGWNQQRTRKYGFTPENLPLNGTVYYPDGGGPFPLVVMVHGNHNANDYSDQGYAYLGELLASQGYICLSVDENFLNLLLFEDYFGFGGLSDDNAARAWLLLEHIQLFEGWNQDPANFFYKKVDMDNIVLMGHSRGGEAVALAAFYNQLKSPPQDPAMDFDYNFNIKGLVSFAGTDGQHQPRGQAVYLENINYLSLHGSHDMDVIPYNVSSYSQFDRIQFNDGKPHFKTAIYIYGANHGQFNRDWGDRDFPGLAARFMNHAQLIPAQAQEEIVKVSVTAFLKATIEGDSAYQDIFKDLHAYEAWLPETLYVSDYWDTDSHVIADFQEDVDPRTHPLPGGEIQAIDLTHWQEEKIPSKVEEAEVIALALGWDHDLKTNPSYQLSFADQDFSDQSQLVFSAADYRQDYQVGDSLLDFSISIRDSKGQVASTLLSQHGRLLPMLDGDIAKEPFANNLGFFPNREPVFQHITISFEVFLQDNSQIDLSQIDQIQFNFDQLPQGQLYLRSIGFR